MRRGGPSEGIRWASPEQQRGGSGEAHPTPPIQRLASQREGPAEDRRHTLGLFAELVFGEAVELEAVAAEVEVSGVVVLEGDGAVVVEVAVGFGDEAGVAPEEINRPATDADVDLGRRQSGAAA